MKNRYNYRGIFIYDLIIIGAGPVGLAAAIEAKRLGLETLILEKGVIVNSIYNFPTHMRFFTTADLLEIGDHPFPSTEVKPTRQMTLDYYRRIAQLENLNILQHHEVYDISGEEGDFEIEGIEKRKGEKNYFTFKSKFIAIATGYFDNPNGLGGIPGEEMDHVDHTYTQPHPFYDHEVVVIGAGNSGAEASLDLYRHGAYVTLIHKNEQPKKQLKYWVGPDLKNRIKEGSINAIMPAETKEIRKDGVIVDTPTKSDRFIPADHVFVLTGYTPNVDWFDKWGLKVMEDYSVKKNEVFETNRNGIYIIGSAGFGKKTNSVFIENGREHAKIAVQAIAEKNREILEIDNPSYK